MGAEKWLTLTVARQLMMSYLSSKVESPRSLPQEITFQLESLELYWDSTISHIVGIDSTAEVKVMKVKR